MSRSHHVFGHVSRVLVVVLILLAGSASVAAAQETTTVRLTVDASIPWAEAESQEIVPAAMPGQLLSDGERFVLILAGEIDDAAQQRLDAFTELGAEEDSIATVDAGETASLSYWLDVALVDGQPWGAFTTVRTQADSGIQVFTMYAAPVERFAEGLASAQDSISINGEPVLDGVEGDGLQDLLVASAPLANDDEESGQQATPDPSGDEEPADPTEEPAAEDEDKSGVDESEDVPYADAGMVGPRQYVSPQFGVEIEWTTDWDLDDAFGDPVRSDRKLGEDNVNLLWIEEWEAWLLIYIFESAPGITIPEVVEFWNSASITTEVYGEGAEVVMSGSSSSLGAVVTLVDEGGPDPTLIYEDVRFGADGTSLVGVRMVSLNPDITQAFIEASNAGITVDGEPILIYYPPADVAGIHAG